MSTYNTNNPRITIMSPPDGDGNQREMEIGQTEAWNEAMFFARVCNYVVTIHHFQGEGFFDRQTFTKDDM